MNCLGPVYAGVLERMEDEGRKEGKRERLGGGKGRISIKLGGYPERS